MVDKVAFELVAPERLLAREQADMVVVPGVEGDFGILPEHAPTVSLLRPGVIQVYQGDRVTERIFVAGGVAEVNPKGCIVLAEDAAPLAELDRATVERQLQDAKEDLADAKDPTELERTRLEARITIAEAKLAALETPAAH